MFDTVAIVGMGLLGGSFGLDLRQRRLAKRILGITHRPETVPAVLERGAADEATTDLSAIASADLIVLAAPVNAIIEGMPEIARHAAPAAVVTDMGSTKTAIVEAGEAALGGRFIGGHPMAGSHEAGIAAARLDLFAGATWVLTPTERTDPDALERLTALVSGLGARPTPLRLADHDRIAAAVSHMPHVVAAAITLSVAGLADGDPRFAELAAGGLRDMTRLAASPANVWRDILASNRENTKAALAAFRASLDAAIAAMDDDSAIEQLFKDSGAARTSLVREKKV